MQTLLVSSLLLPILACAAPVEINKPTGESSSLLRFVRMNDQEDGHWVSEQDIKEFGRNNIHFMDVTDHLDLDPKKAQVSQLAYPAAFRANTVGDYLDDVRLDLLQDTLTHLSQDFNTRYYKSESGAQSAQWIYEQVVAYASGRSDITVEQVQHNGYNQKSVVARFQGSSSLEDCVIVGAHQDSVNWQASDQTTGRSPGADDDGSGAMTILEAFRVLAHGNYAPALPLEFHWYAAEEVGLYGSQDISAAYNKAGRKVYAMFNIDMTGYTADNKPVRVIQDHVDAALTEVTERLIDEYTLLARRDHMCGYACSDHASWTAAGFPAATTFEPITSPAIHTAQDDLNMLNWPQMVEFVKLTVSFAVELSLGPN